MAIGAGLEKKVTDEAEKDFEANERAGVTSEIKTGNARIDPSKFGALGQSMGSYDPRKGSGMYSGAAQFMAANASQGARSANKAYDANEMTKDEVTFDSALNLKNNAAGKYDRALLSGYEGPSQKTAKLTKEEAKKNVDQRFGALGGSMSAAQSNIWNMVNQQITSGQDAAKEKYVKEAIKAKVEQQKQAALKIRDHFAALKSNRDARNEQLKMQAIKMDALRDEVKRLGRIEGRGKQAYMELLDMQDEIALKKTQMQNEAAARQDASAREQATKSVW